MNLPTSKSVDVHTHIFCWGEDPKRGFLSKKTQRSVLSRILLHWTGIHREKGDTISEKIQSRLLSDLEGSHFDYIVLLAQDAVYTLDGEMDMGRTHFYVSNDLVLDLARKFPRILPGCSINPMRWDALKELERCWKAGSRLIKIHTAIQGADPSEPRFDAFYKLAKDLGVVVMFHTGYEHACTVVSQKFTDPLRLQRPLDHGLIVIAAHCGSCAFFDPEDYYPHFIDMATRYPNLYGDTAVMGTMARLGSLKRLSKEPASIRDRILHGSDYPFPPAHLPYVHRVGLFPHERKNPLDMDLCIKRAYQPGVGYEDRVISWLL